MAYEENKIRFLRKNPGLNARQVSCWFGSGGVDFFISSNAMMTRNPKEDSHKCEKFPICDAVAKD